METRTSAELRQLQLLPLDIKIKKTQQRIKEWVDYYGENGVAISFSGGKDSTVLMDIARKMLPNIKAFYIDTGLEFPEIRNFVKTFDNVDWVKPKLTFKQVIEKYGYPFISKEVTENTFYPKIWFDKLCHEDEQFSEFLRGGGDICEIIDSDRLREIIINLEPKSGPKLKIAQLLGMRTKDNLFKLHVPKEEKSHFDYSRYSHILAAPYIFSNKCCNTMKKEPAHRYHKDHEVVFITAQMASESLLRKNIWLKYGCNAFNATHPISNPMSFWLEQDVLLYIKKYNINYCKEVYGDIVDENGNDVDLTDFEDNGIFELNRPILKTTGASRTGCMFCGFGCHLEKENESRFVKMKETHPNQYNYIMKDKEEGGLGYKKVIDWLNENLNLHIFY